MTCRCNDNYRAESRNVGIPVDQVKPNTTKKFVVSVQDQQYTVFRTSNNNQAAVVIHEKRGCKKVILLRYSCFR